MKNLVLCKKYKWPCHKNYFWLIFILYMCVCVYVCVYICMCVHALIHIQLEWKITTLFSLFPLIIVNTGNLNSSCYRSHSQGCLSFCPCFNNILHIFKSVFVFISWFVTQIGSISNPIFILNSSWIFTDGIFFYFCLLALMCVSPIHYIFDH